MRHALKQTLRYVIAWGIVPVLLVALFELGLRAAGYGESLAPFVERQCDGQTVYVRNRAFFQQFIGWGLSLDNWEQTEFSVPAKKADKTYRIFVFGESAPEGSPDPFLSFSRYLAAMLRARYPGVNFEVYNGAFRAVNSHAIRPEALACARFQPDLYIVYMGNNEISGPFSLNTTSRWSPTTLSLRSVHARIALNEARVVQFMKHLRSRRRSAFPIAPPSMIIRPDDDRLPAVYANHRQNVRDVCQAGLDAGSQVFLCTVPVNLRNWTPAHSFHLNPLSPENQQQWDQLFERGRTAQDADRLQEAADAYEAARHIDDTYAELHFRLGECFWGLGVYDRAKERFQRALNLDSFDFMRSKQPINDSVRALAAELGPQGLQLVDAEQALAANSEHGCPGLDVFCDHCHFSIWGAYCLAATIFRQLSPALPDWVQREVKGNSAPLTYEECIRRVGVRPFMLYDRSNDAREHFCYGSGAKREVDALLDRLKEESSDLYEKMCVVHREAAALSSHDYMLRFQFTRELIGKKEFDTAVDQGRMLVAEFPFRRVSHRLLAIALGKAGKTDEAIAEFRKSAAYYPDDISTYDEWANLLAELGRRDEQIRVLQKAQAYDLMQESFGGREATVLELSGKIEKAERTYIKAIWANPLFPDAYMKLDALYARHFDPQYRADAWRKLAEDLRKVSLPYLRLACALADMEDLDASMAAYRKAAEINPSDRSIPTDIRLLQQRIDARNAAPPPPAQ